MIDDLIKEKIISLVISNKVINQSCQCIVSMKNCNLFIQAISINLANNKKYENIFSFNDLKSNNKILSIHKTFNECINKIFNIIEYSYLNSIEIFENKLLLTLKECSKLVFVLFEIKENDIKNDINNFIDQTKGYINNSLNNNFITLKNYHSSNIINIVLLNDGRLSSGSSDGIIIIYNKYNFMNIDLIIKVGSGIRFYYTQLSNNNIAVCCNDSSIKIFELSNDNKYKLLQCLEKHILEVCKVVEIKEKNLLISCSWGRDMKIWEKNENNIYENIKSLIITPINLSPTNIFRINERILLSAGSRVNIIKLWDIKNDFALITIIKNIEFNIYHSLMCMVNDNILLIGGKSKGIYIINIKNTQIISYAEQQNIINPMSMIKLSNGNILVGCFYKNNDYISLIEYKYTNGNLIEINSNKNIRPIRDKNALIELKNGIIISCSSDKSIKFWK